MSEEWGEVVHEVKLMVERLDAFHDDLKAAHDSGALTAMQKKFTALMMNQAYDTEAFLKRLMEALTRAGAAEEGEAQG